MKPRAFVAAIFIGFSGGGLVAADAGTLEQQQAQMRFQAMDANRDGRISRAEWRGSDQSFRRHDWNGDGILSGDEVRTGASRLPGEDDDFEQTRRPEFRNWTERGFTTLDRNRDGRIERTEWFYDREGFIRAERNDDGALTRASFWDSRSRGSRRPVRKTWTSTTTAASSAPSGTRARSVRVARPQQRQRPQPDRGGRRERRAGAICREASTSTTTTDPTDEWRWSRRSFARQADQERDGQLTRRELTNAGCK